jgi:hypothetical protein
MPSASRGLQAVNSFDPAYGVRTALAEIAQAKAHWAGIPMPLDGERLVIEPSFPNAEALMGIGLASGPDPDRGLRLRNRWYSRRHGCDIYLMDDEETGRVTWGKIPAMHSVGMALSTLGCSAAWGIEQEGRAVQLLGTMLRHSALKQYLLTGMFLERSPRSGVTYLFRKLRPTVAIAAHPGLPESRVGATMLAALCMHPIGYYAGTWAGAMCPTDDVIAHLSLMRADEAMFWRRCNQHPAYRPEAGL